MHRHWSEFGPPVYVAVAAYMGITKTKASPGDPARDDDDPAGLGELIRMFGDGGVIGEGGIMP